MLLLLLLPLPHHPNRNNNGRNSTRGGANDGQHCPLRVTCIPYSGRRKETELHERGQTTASISPVGYRPRPIHGRQTRAVGTYKRTAVPGSTFQGKRDAAFCPSWWNPEKTGLLDPSVETARSPAFPPSG